MFDPILLSASPGTSYQEMGVESLTERQLETWREARIVVLVGSYISTFSPTNLPMGNQVGEYLWTVLFDGVHRSGRSWPPR